MNDSMIGVPKRLQMLISDVVTAHNAGRALALNPDDAVMLREHGLITIINKPTALGFAVAGDYLGE